VPYQDGGCWNHSSVTRDERGRGPPRIIVVGGRGGKRGKQRNAELEKGKYSDHMRSRGKSKIGYVECEMK